MIFFVSKKNTIAEFLDIDRTKWGLKHLGSTILEGYNDFDELYLKNLRIEYSTNKFFRYWIYENKKKFI